ncbi:MAG: LysM peptidoglycan-binding domain-containing protein, partial [Bacteroidales bacterium]|nr:LysM peptidoglycan-binding domain-containing protein [Bacteroidales bacterium]
YIYGSGGSSYSSSSSSSSSKTTSSSSSSSSSGSYTYYTVKSGDTLYSISQKYARVSVADIQKANGIGTNIKPGQKLKIPKK